MHNKLAGKRDLEGRLKFTIPPSPLVIHTTFTPAHSLHTDIHTKLTKTTATWTH